ncbi:hypothetical protein [Serratia entomophila]|uniref:hypothetical protein n=1 Tax=Serratia entomophila TaxID=42906 RepID=UPI00217A8145|nr:hypothetical protein [Serratia entomophila]CAI0856586.1 Uncharacterised protein [Serratia entomophila]CAI1523836.1 Uncharacterised protein [Serratia entomophila]CAI1574582.1 Uncharacterised protein [Serratia entomophila]CAI1704946.1 Uncharacterised protein [Serratia entomophila]CAI1807848.1 Uncharacterised protein [Serratia entomophila]
MKHDLSILLGKVRRFLLTSAFLAALVSLIFIDVHWLHNFVYETSLTEIAQELMLASVSACFFTGAVLRRAYRPAWALIGGFFLCMLIREMDFAFDLLWHGAWVWFALAVTLVCLAFGVRHRAAALRGLVHFVSHPNYGMMCAGLLCILVFSRLFGMHVLWQELMLDGYNRVVKNMVEEGCELVGYGFCLMATLGYMRQSPAPV